MSSWPAPSTRIKYCFTKPDLRQRLFMGCYVVLRHIRTVIRAVAACPWTTKSRLRTFIHGQGNIEDPAAIKAIYSLSTQLTLAADEEAIARASDMCKRLITRDEFGEAHKSSRIASCSGVTSPGIPQKQKSER